MTPTKVIVQVAKIEQRILLIRGEKVIIDADLAGFYGVPTKRLNEQVKRNKERFPKDFMFHIYKEEWEAFQPLRSQNATLKRGLHQIPGTPYIIRQHHKEKSIII
jgi:ORF6N domain